MEGGLSVEQHGVVVDEVSVDVLGPRALAGVGGGEEGLGDGRALGVVVAVDDLLEAVLVLDELGAGVDVGAVEDHVAELLHVPRGHGDAVGQLLGEALKLGG